ncbi:TauD/TfdA family dioxygenase [Candidatus Marithioploca araucensis]|uniref:TauD/TfdA family dioxygenase n=1 Tax=Candidatus Marithioploca araucensis TaxID=70273 RepID=A0ABT7VRC0_9GAMM|nr:TauD/TfdA family dioxygenase [Candidatus Marithioploca araucensis]
MIQQTNTHFKESPFNLDNENAYQTWRARKLENYPSDLSKLVVEINDLQQLTRAEHEAILACCRVANMAIFSSTIKKDKSIFRELGKQLGLTQLDNNMCADDDSITSLTVAQEGMRQTYIPYTNRPIHWHTDGYYNSLDKQIYALLLYCVHPAQQGGENALLDHEIAYILLRDKNPDYVHAFMQPYAMCIPPNVIEGEEIRPTRCGPVFSIDSNGNLHTRYTKRTRSITWASDEITQAAVKCFENILESDSAYIFRGTLQAGQGLLSNNVLHNRSGFTDSELPNQQRLLYRARYYKRIANT